MEKRKKEINWLEQIWKTLADAVQIIANTYTKEEVDNMLALIKQFTYQNVEELPETPSADTMWILYFVPAEDSSSADDLKDEYVTIRDGEEGNYTYRWEKVGSTRIDLSGYCRKMGIVELDVAAASQNLVDNTYYDIEAAVGTANFVLPSMTDDGYVHSIMLKFTTSSTPQITFSSADSATIEYILGWGFDPSAKYEVNCLFDGTKWTLTYGRIA